MIVTMGKTPSQVTPGHEDHLVAGRRWLPGLRGQREPGLEAREDVYLLLVLQGLGLAEPALVLLGVLPGVEVAGMVEAEDDPVLVIFLVVVGAEHLRAEITGSLAHRVEDAREPL